MDIRTDGRARAGALALTGALLLAGCGGGDGGGSGATGTAAPSPSGSAAVPVDGAVASVQAQFEKVVDDVLPSVVKIATDSGEGSGVIYDAQGNIVTNAHVVAGAKEIEVTVANENQPLKAQLVGSFPADDLAVVRVSGASLKPARFGDSAKLRVGTMVLAMGNPLGLSGSVTDGIVSALNRTVSTKREGAFPGATIGNAIQTSAAINPGNSGGALVTLNGEVVGIPTAAASDPQMGGAAVGIGFATPSSTVRQIAPQLIQNGKVTNSGRAALGVVVRPYIDPQTFRPAGIVVVEVTRGGPADKAGIKPDEVLVSVNGTPITNLTSLSETLVKLKPGEVAKVEVQDPNGQKRTVDVTLGELPGT